MKKRPSSIDVARRAEVSQATVSYVLSGRRDKTISEETRARVMRAADELGYLPNRLADGILRGKTSTIGVLMSDFAHSFNALVLQGLEETFGEQGYRSLIAHNRNTPEYERHQVRMLMEHRVDGIVTATDEQTLNHIGEWIAEATRAGVPVCVVDDTCLAGQVDTVVSDDVVGARLAVEHLIQQGHRRIAYLGGGERASTSRERRKGYEDALAAHGIERHPNWVLGTSYWVDRDPDLKPVLSMDSRPTAVFCASDGLAARAMMVLRDQGYLVPEDIAFVGYGDLEWARYMRLTTVHQNPMEMGRIAASLLLARLGGDAGTPVTHRLEPSLVVRRSSISTPEQNS